MIDRLEWWRVTGTGSSCPRDLRDGCLQASFLAVFSVWKWVVGDVSFRLIFKRIVTCFASKNGSKRIVRNHWKSKTWILPRDSLPPFQDSNGTSYREACEKWYLWMSFSDHEGQIIQRNPREMIFVVVFFGVRRPNHTEKPARNDICGCFLGTSRVNTDRKICEKWWM